MVKTVFRHRYGMSKAEGVRTDTVHNWDGKTFDKHGYPVADCGARLYPRNTGLREGSDVCRGCFK